MKTLSETIPEGDPSEFQKEVNRVRVVKFKVARCPFVIYERFKNFTEQHTGNLYPAAIEKLLDAYTENEYKKQILSEIDGIKEYLGYLEAEIMLLKGGNQRTEPAPEKTTKGKRKVFGESNE